MQEVINPELVNAFLAFLSAVFLALAGAAVRSLSKWAGPAGTLLAEQAVELANARLRRGIENELVKRGFLNEDRLPPDEVDAIEIAGEVARQMPDALKSVRGNQAELANIVPGVLANMASAAVKSAATEALRPASK